MIWSLAETLHLIEPYVPCQLVTPQVFANIKAVAAVLPDAMSAYFLECRLGADAPQVDFLTCVVVSSGGRDVLAGPDSGLADSLLEHPLWRGIGSFWRQWADPLSPLYPQIPLAWLEFDQVDKPPSGIPLPCPTFCLDPEISLRRRPCRALSESELQKCRQVAEISLEQLSGQPLSSQTRQKLFACLELLPPGGRISHIGSMQSRQPSIVKVYASVPGNHLLAYLADIDWPGPLAEIEKMITSFGPAPATAKPDLTLGDAILPRLGLEFSQPASAQDEAQQYLLEQCVVRGLCTPEKRQALLSWPGSSRETFGQTSWPVTLRRWLDVKIVYQPNQPFEAKAYLGFRPSFSLF